MPYAVTLDLDPHGAGALAPLFDAVERADADAMTPRRARIAPHLSLAVYDRLVPAAITVSLQHFAEAQAAIGIPLASLGLFPGRHCSRRRWSRPSCWPCTAPTTRRPGHQSRVVGPTTCRRPGCRTSRSAEP